MQIQNGTTHMKKSNFLQSLDLLISVFARIKDSASKKQKSQKESNNY